MIELKSLSKSYQIGKRKFCALKDVDLTINAGELVAVVGKSGAGKSTLLNVLGMVDTWDSGSYTLDGIDVGALSDTELAGARNEKIGFVLQDFALIEDQSVLFNVSLPLILGKAKYREITPKAIAALERVGLADQKSKRVNQMSGGQKQRVAIARAIINEPSLILADEPTGALDSTTGQEIVALLKELNKAKNTTVIIVTHDESVSQACDRIIHISDGVVE